MPRFGQTTYGGLPAAASGSYVTGTYTGDGTQDRTITLGFQPVFVALMNEGTAGQMAFLNSPGGERVFGGATNTSLTASKVTATGFIVQNSDSINGSGAVYRYIAFR